MKKAFCDTAGSERTFMSGVFVLSMSTVIVKIIGLVYKIPLLSVLGAEGMGYFNSAYEIFALICGVSTAGLPVAVSMLISSAREMGDEARVGKIFKTSSALLVTKGVLVSGGLAALAMPVSSAVGNPDAYFALLAISPAILFSCVSGAVRGYFQGCRNMTPTAVCQMLEAAGKLVFGVALAALSAKMGMSVPVCAAFAVLGVSLGSLAAAVYLFFKKRAEDNIYVLGGTSGYTQRRCLFELVRISLPITVGSALMGSTRIIDMALILRRLGDIGVSSSQANVIYGSYTTLAMPIYSLVPAFIPPITESLIPRLSAAAESRDKDEQKNAVSNSVRLTVFLSIPASMGIIVYSRQILELLFAGQREAIDIAAPLLAILGVSVMFSCLTTTAIAILQSYRRVMLPILSLAVGAVVKAVSANALIGNADVGVMGAPISTLLFNITVLVLDLAFVYRCAPKGVGILRLLTRPLIASAVAITASYAVYLPLDSYLSSRSLSFFVAVAVAVVMYFALSVLMGVVSKQDMALIGRKK